MPVKTPKLGVLIQFWRLKLKDIKLKVLILGGGVSEDIIASKVKESEILDILFLSKDISNEVNIEITANILNFIKKYNIELVILTSKKYLSNGLIELLKSNKILTIGPDLQIASNRRELRDFLQQQSIPTLPCRDIDNVEAGRSYSEKIGFPVIVKTDDFIISKTNVCYSEEEVKEFLTYAIKDKIYGEKGSLTVIEKLFPGKILSIGVLIQNTFIMTLPYCYHFDDQFASSFIQTVHIPHLDVDKKITSNIERLILFPLVHRINRKFPDYSGILWITVLIGEKGTYFFDLDTGFDPLFTSTIFSKIGRAHV